MENNIDKLQLDISVTGNAASSAKDINNLATAISNLQSKIGKTFETSGINKISSEIKNVKVSLDGLSTDSLIKIADDQEIRKGQKLSKLLLDIQDKYNAIIKQGGKLTEAQTKDLEEAQKALYEINFGFRKDVTVKPPKTPNPKKNEEDGEDKKDDKKQDKKEKSRLAAAIKRISI